MADSTIKRVTAANAAALAACAALSAQCFAQKPAQQWGVDQLAQHLTQNDNALFAAFADQQLVAFALFTLVKGEGELLSICSDPARRRAGHARKLLSHAITALKPKKLLLEVAADNLAALRLYEGLGFREMGRRKAYYAAENGPKVDAIVMTLSHAK